MTLFVACFLSWLIYSTTCLKSSSQVWTWQCKEQGDELGPKCIRQLLTANSSYEPLSMCLLTCGDFATLLPRPNTAVLGKQVVRFLPSKVTYSPTSCQDKVCSLLNEAAGLMIQTLDRYHPKFGRTPGILLKDQTVPSIANHKVTMKFNVSGKDEYPAMSTNESYSLDVSTEGEKTIAVITAPTFFGARHGLETLTQLMDYDPVNNALLILASASIQDAPAFPYRGLLLDTSRNFLSVQTLKRILDGMAYNKLNVFHWHLTDAASFPLKLDSLPQMAIYGTYSPEEVYTAEDVKELVQYARLRGIRIIPELDAPAHAGHGWQWGEAEGLGKLVVCLDKQPWKSYCAGPPCGQMNLANENLYKVLEKVYVELVEMFSPIEMFHFGGDEVNFNCWSSSVEMTNWTKDKGYGLDETTYFKQWAIFQERSRQLLIKANHGKEVPGIVWTSKLTKGQRATEYLGNDKYIIQVWTKGDAIQIKDLLKGGFQVIMSNYDSMYLDCGVSSWLTGSSNWCSPYKGWQDIYDNNIQLMAKQMPCSENKGEILGGEAAAWSEQIDENTIDAKLWPRGAALAERLWSNPSKNYSFAEYRMLHHRHRLVQKGLMAARLQPEWCRQNGGQCRKGWEPEEEEEEAVLDIGQKWMFGKNFASEYKVRDNGASANAFLGTTTTLQLVYMLTLNVIGIFFILKICRKFLRKSACSAYTLFSQRVLKRSAKR